MANAIEIMLKSMGLGPAVEQARMLAEAGALQRVMKFADEISAHTAVLERMAALYEADLNARGITLPYSGPALPRTDSGAGGRLDGDASAPLKRTGTD